jgi:hypothetical protein
MPLFSIYPQSCERARKKLASYNVLNVLTGTGMKIQHLKFSQQRYKKTELAVRE